VSWWLLPVVLFYSILQLLLGIAIGMWLKDRRLSAARANEDRNRELLSRLNQLAATMAVDVGEHSTRIEEISSTLKPQDDTKPTEETALLETIEQIVSANEQLCTKLATAEQQLNEQAEQINFHLAEARIDSLTELPNRRHFDHELTRRFSEWQRTANPFCLAMLDIDHFKQINDRYGHQAGDKILHDVGKRLTSTMRDVDIVARYGGEEFAIILSSTSFEDAKCAAERARHAIGSAPFEYENKSIKVTMSVGLSDVACCESPTAMIKRADAGLYAAKKAGRNSSYANDGRQCLPVKAAAPKAAPKRIESTPESAGEDAAAAQAAVDALTDWVTGLPNRRAFSDQLRTRINEAHERHSPLALVVVTVEGFADCASLHGQDVVDNALRLIAETIRSVARKGDVVTRYGWDGFAVILGSTDAAVAKAVATAISATLGELPAKQSTMAGIQLRLGAATLKPEDDVVSLAKRADASVQECGQGIAAELVG
jgi:diguanylate cyclase (GGDEF)-like protein